MNLTIPRSFLGLLEPIAGAIYFSPEALDGYRAMGLEDPWSAYFCSRACAMGRVSAEVVAATFYNFNPDLVRRTLRWDLAEPEAVLAARYTFVGATLRRLLAPENGDFPDVRRAADLLAEAAGGCEPDGRPLYSAWAGLPWPEDDVLRLWHGANLLREYRGDGHIAALVTHGVSGIEALCLHAPYMDVKREIFFAMRQWDEDASAHATAGLVERGLLSPDGRLSDAGWKFREMIERETDRLALAPFTALGPEGCEEALGLLEPLAGRIVERKGVPRAFTRIARQPA